MLCIQVIRRIRRQILIAERAARPTKAVQYGSIHLQIREFAGIIQTVVDNARNRRALAVHLSLALNQRCNRYNIMHRPTKAFRTGLDVRIIFVLKVVEHFVDGVDHRCITLVNFVGIREQIPLQPAFGCRQLILQEGVLERIFVQCFVKRILGTDMLIEQQLLDLRNRIALRNGNFHCFLARSIDQRINNLTIVHIGVERIRSSQYTIIVALDTDIKLENSAVIDDAFVIKLLCQRNQVGIFRNRDFLHCIFLDKRKNVIGNKNCRQRQNNRNTQHGNDINHRTCTSAVDLATAAAAVLLRLRNPLCLLIDIIVHCLTSIFFCFPL